MEWLGSAGAFVAGVIATLAIEHGIAALWRNRLGPRWNRYRLRRRTAGLVSEGEVLLPGPEPIFVAQFEPGGIRPENVHCQRVQRSPLPEYRRAAGVLGVNIPSDTALADVIEREVVRIREQPGAWNGESLALAKLAISRTGPEEDTDLQLSFARSDHATSRTMQRYWREAEMQPDTLTGDQLRDVCVAFSHGFGLNATVETADGQLILTRRGAATSQHHGRLHISVNEGMRPDDLDPTGAPDPLRTLLRGCAEELGVSPAPEQVTLHSLILDVARYEWAFLAHVDLRGTEFSASEIQARRVSGQAQDDWEMDRLEFLPFRVEHIVDQLLGTADWVPHGLVNLGLSAIHRFPPQAQTIRTALASRERGRR